MYTSFFDQIFYLFQMLLEMVFQFALFDRELDYYEESYYEPGWYVVWW